MDGFIVVDKPAGVTSHDVVRSVRRIAGMKKVGHTGTLDPFATGVLPVALGEGTKAIPFLDESVKEYRATMRLGEATDTQDCTGAVIQRGDCNHLTSEKVREVAALFMGSLQQVPPMFSALKQGGVPLYKMARRGVEVPREPRQIQVFALEIERIALPEVAFTVRCSRGTYVRTLASDIGDMLGCGAHLLQLRRTVSGPFTLSEAVTLETLATLADAGQLSDTLVTPLAALGHLPELFLTDSGRQRVVHGISPEMTDFLNPPPEGFISDRQVRLAYQGKLLAVAEPVAGTSSEAVSALRLLRVFN